MTLTAWMALMAGCQAAPRITSDDPVQRAQAVKRAALGDDVACVPLLVERLEDDDPAVRFYAVLALRRLAGDDFGFDYAIDPTRQQPAVQRWRDYASAHLEPKARGSSSDGDEAGPKDAEGS